MGSIDDIHNTRSRYALIKKVLPLGGFWWQLMDGNAVKVNPKGGWNSGQNVSVTPANCKQVHQQSSSCW